MSADRLIVDGYNLLHAHPVYGPLVSDDIDSARAHLVSDLAGYAQGGPGVTVVFDGTANPTSDGTPHHIGHLCVIFSRAGTSADSVIEALARRARERGERATVVTSDSATRDTVRTGTVSVLSSEHFVQDLASDAVARREMQAATPRRGQLSERVTPDVHSVLSRWARGESPS